MSKDKGIVDFGSVEYSDRIAKAKEGFIPVGGAPMPAIPRLDSQPQDPNIPQRQVRATDLLTPEARQQAESEGRLIPGVGSAYAKNQPFATGTAPPKEGEQTYVNPPRPEGSGLRPETIEQLKGAAQVAGVEREPATPSEAQTTKEDADDGFDFGEFGQQIRSLINNKQRREAIEARITDKLDLEDLLVHMELRQTVPIIPGRFMPTYRSVGGHEDIWVKRQMGVETGSETYLTDRYAMMNLTAGLYAINGKVLQAHLDKDGYVDQTSFEAKYRQILRYPFQVLADLSINYVWFMRRVERALVVDDIKGF